MTINGQDKRFNLKIEKDKVVLIGLNDTVEMDFDEAEILSRIILDQIDIFKEAIGRNG